MTRYVPPYADYCDLRDKFMELVCDYLLLYEMRGVKSYEDIDLSQIFPERYEYRRDEALRTAEYLLDTVEHIDVLAQYAAAELGDVWPNLVAILERVGPHDSFKPLWVVAKA